MKNENIARVLKEYRNKNHYSVNEVSDMLKEHAAFAAPKTIYGWESGQAQPDADTLMILCEIYNIDNILETFGYTEGEPFHITTFEKQLIEAYRNHPQMQDAIHRLLDM